MPLAAQDAVSLYDAARRAEQRGDYAGAVNLYKRVASINPSGAAAGQAVFKIAVIYDERLHDPNSALTWYTRHADTYNDRNARRSELRLKALEKYRGADPVKFGEYQGILNSIERRNRMEVAEKLKGFIDANPGLSYLDEALLWLANEYRGSMRKLTTPGELAGMEKAVVIYRRIVDNYPKGEARLAALKNLGDAFLMKNDYGKAREYYRQVVAEGGEQGRILIGAHWRLAQVETFRRGMLYGAVFIFCLMLGLLAYLLPLREFSFAGVKKGLYHALFFLPLPVFLTVLTVAFTEPGKSNITGREQYLMMTLTGLLFAGVLINGLVTEAEERVKINFKAYASFLAVMMLCAVYMAFYHFRMLQHIERLFI
jgi:tetratricopeptide (TPR) repeat protein